MQRIISRELRPIWTVSGEVTFRTFSASNHQPCMCAVRARDVINVLRGGLARIVRPSLATGVRTTHTHTYIHTSRLRSDYATRFKKIVIQTYAMDDVGGGRIDARLQNRVRLIRTDVVDADEKVVERIVVPAGELLAAVFACELCNKLIT